MPLTPDPIPPLPEVTKQVAHAAFPQGNRSMQMRDHLGSLYTDSDVAALVPSRGHAAEAPWRLAVVTIWHLGEQRTDRPAADAVRRRIDWKYGVSWDRQDSGFAHTVAPASFAPAWCRAAPNCVCST